MNCPNCGTEVYNMQRCPVCGASNTPVGEGGAPAREQQRAESHSAVQEEITSDQMSFADTEISGDLSIFSGEEEIFIPVEAAKPSTRKRKIDDEEFDYIADDTPRSQSGKKAVIFLLIVALLMVGGFFVNEFVQSRYDGWNALFASLFGGAGITQDEEQAEAVIQPVTEGGKSAHRITISGTKGEVVEIEALGLRDVIEQTSVQFTIFDTELPESVLLLRDDVTYVQIEQATATFNDQVRRIKIPEYALSSRLTPLQIVSPATQSLTTNESTIEFNIKTVQGATVVIDGNTVSDMVSADGYVSYKLPIDWQGRKEIKISALMQGGTENIQTVIVNHADDPVALEFLPALPKEVDTETIEITGNHDPQATLTTTAVLEGALTSNADGAFAFKAKLKFGLNAFTITVSLDDGAETVRHVEISRKPEINSYTRVAQVMDYERIIYNNDKLTDMNMIFLCAGTIVEIQDTEDATLQKVIMRVEDSEDDRLVIDYHGRGQLKEGAAYRIFAHVDGMEGGFPRMSGWFLQ
ncbi:MAG: hypothetical protein ACOYJC_04220 [Christensenellales bacterium]|jgi:hypothetical protein